MRWILTLVGAMTFLCAASPAEAEVTARPDAAAVFDAPALSDVELSGMRGTFASGGRLTVGGVVRVADNEARDVFRQTGGVAPTIVDWWWGTVGLELIAENVRTAGAP